MLDFQSRNSYNISMKSTVSEKGQVTIPKALRIRLGIRAGQTLDFEVKGGQLVAKKLVEESWVDKVYGIIKTDESTDEYIDRIRGKADAV